MTEMILSDDFRAFVNVMSEARKEWEREKKEKYKEMCRIASKPFDIDWNFHTKEHGE